MPEALPEASPEPLPEALPAGFRIDLSIEADAWGEEGPLALLAGRMIAVALAVADLKVQDNSEVSLLFTDDEAIRALNTRWRAKNKATNVLSFPGSDPQGEVYGPLLGDIVLARETVEREAAELGIEFSDHLSHLIVHGLLHLFDYDHQENDEAERMESLEKAILAALEIDDPYTDRPLLADGR